MLELLLQSLGINKESMEKFGDEFEKFKTRVETIEAKLDYIIEKIKRGGMT